MSDTYNHVSGTVRITDKDTGEERDITLILPDLQDPLILAAHRPCVARAGITLGDGVFRNSYKVYIGGEVSCSEGDFWSGEAHHKMVHHLVEVAKPVVRKIEDKWLNEESKRRTCEKFPQSESDNADG